MISKINLFHNQHNINNFKTRHNFQVSLKTNNENNVNSKSEFEDKKNNLFISSNNIAFLGRSSLLDSKYRKQLAKGINRLFPDLNCKSSDLQSIIGVDELTKVLKTANPESFSTGRDLENVKNGIFTINLHTHTDDSDGRFTVEELLNTAAEYANRINKLVYIGITNHDSINDLVRAVQITAKNKEKFRNLKIVLGIEFNAKYENPEMFSKPLQLEMIGYCINPFDDKFNKFMRNIKTNNTDYAQEFIEKVNEQYGTQIDFEQLKDYDSSLRNGGSPSFLWKLKKYLIKRVEALGHSNEHVEDLFKAHAEKYGDLKITPATPSMNDIIEVVNNTAGMVGIAHPVRNRAGWKINSNTREEREARYYEVLYAFIRDFKKSGGKVLEADYQYQPRHLVHPNKLKKRDFVHRVCKELDLLSSSGLDNHHKDLFSS